MANSDMGVLVHQGLLIKSPPEHKSKDLGRWKKRYFKLWSCKKLEYFKNEKSEKRLKKPIDLNQCKGIDANLKNKKWDNIFCLKTELRKYFLVADSADSMRNWISKICDVCGFTEQEQELIESTGKLNIIQVPGSPSYSRENRSIDSSPKDATQGHEPMEKICENLPSYDKDLPPLPDSSSSENIDEDDSELSDSPQPVIGSPFSSGIKQCKSNVYSDTVSSAYDMVPPPRLAVEPTLPYSPTRKEHESAPFETANTESANDESYVDMQQPSGNTYDFVPKSTLRYNPGAYSFVPTATLANQADQGSYGNYDKVPSSATQQDEYIPCDIITNGNDKNAPPPVPDQTYTGFETLPSNSRILQRRTKEIAEGNSDGCVTALYDMPPRNSGGFLIQQTYPKSSSNEVPHEQQLPNDHDEISLSESGQEIYDIPPSLIGNEAQDIYDRPPVPKRDDQENIYNIPPAHGENIGQEIYDFPPKNVQSYEPDIYDRPPVPKRDDQENIYNIPPAHGENIGQEIYDFPPKNIQSFEQDIYDRPPVQSWGNECDMKGGPEVNSMPYQSKVRKNDLLYDNPPNSQVSDHAIVSQNHGTRSDEATSPADLFNFGFNSPPPWVDRSLKHSSTGGMVTMGNCPPPVDRKTRPVLANSVPVFPEEVERHIRTFTQSNDGDD